ncbi:MAG: cell wall hydrolase [bacterium]|nr:cell wall hydrolase [bacterium]
MAKINLSGKNLPYMRNPFLDKAQITSWYNCYKIAGQIMAGEVSDPTGGANHYYSEFIKPPYWTKGKNAHFKFKIGNTLFYEIKSNKRGFIKIKIAVLIFVSLIVLVFSGLYLAVAINNRLSCEQGISGEYGNEKYKHYYINPKTEEVEVAYFNEEGKILRTVQLTYDGYPKSQVNAFPYTEMIGYFANLHKKDELINYPYREARDKYYRNYVSLMIKRQEFDDPEEVFRGDVLTSLWKWKDRSHVIVYHDCGLNCLMPYEIDINTGRTYVGEPLSKEEKTIDILETPLDKLVKGEYEEMFFIVNGKKQRVVYKNRGIDHLAISPTKKKVGFFYESGDYYEPCHKVALTVVNIQDKEAKKIYESDCKISRWEWVGDDQAAVYKNCGTECQTLHLVDIDSEEENILQYGVDYNWSPDKKLVLAYHFSLRYGITVGNKIGDELLTIEREWFPADNNNMVYATKAIWSPNSTKLVVILKKEKEDKMELIVYNVKDNFKKIYQADVFYKDETKIYWSDNNRNIVYGDLVINLD